VRCPNPDCREVLKVQATDLTEVPVEVQPVAESTPAPVARASTPRRDQERIAFHIQVQKDPQKLLKGAFEAQLTADGLRLRKGKKQEFLVAPGESAQYLTGNRLSLLIEDRWVEVTVVKFGWYQTRLATDVAEYLNGERDVLYPEEYKLPWYLYAVAFLPLGIPIISQGGAIWGGLGGGLFGACLGLAQVERIPVGVRVLLALALSAIGYLILFLAGRHTGAW